MAELAAGEILPPDLELPAAGASEPVLLPTTTGAGLITVGRTAIDGSAGVSTAACEAVDAAAFAVSRFEARMVEATVTGVEATIADEPAGAVAVAVEAAGAATPPDADGAASFELAVADARDRAKSSPDPDVALDPDAVLEDEAALGAGAGVETLSWARKAAEDMLAVAPQVKD